MKLDCINGYFIFKETKSGQISDFMSGTGLVLAAKDDYYTFEALKDAPRYSLAGLPYLGTPAIATFEGNPWDIFDENQFVFDFRISTIVPILSIVQKTQILQAGNKFYSPGLILPGSVTDNGQRVKGYSAWYSRDIKQWRYTAVYYV